MRVLVLNGPNLDMLGRREPEVYGAMTLSDLDARLGQWGGEMGVEVETFQSNHEGALVERIHASNGFDGILINPGALTHTSRALGDALATVEVPAVEVHISNVHRREPWRAVSLVAERCVYRIYGRGVEGYHHALRHLRNRAAWPAETVAYGPEEDQVADLRLPQGGAAALVALIHGGFWLDEWTRDTVESLAVDLARRGIATLNLEYRRLGRVKGWPAPGHDIVTALGFASSHEALAGLPYGVVGHSAGGYLGLWAATRGAAPPPRLLVGLAPVTDLEALVTGPGPGAGPATALLEAGAPTSVAPGGPTLLAHGQRDDVVTPEHSRRWSDRARVELLPDEGHFGLLDPERDHWPLLVTALDNALR